MLGILGGMGSHAGIHFQNKFLAIAEENGAVKDKQYPPFCYINYPQTPNRTNRILFEKKLRKYDKEPESPFPMLLDGVQKLKAMGCEYVVIACNTAHHWSERLQKESGVHILDLIANAKTEVTKMGKGRYLLLATEGTYEMGLYNNIASANDLVIPNKEDQKLLMEAIYGEAFMGRYYSEYRPLGVKMPLKSGYNGDNFDKNDLRNPQKIILDIIAKYSASGDIKAVIAGCTEIPLCINDSLLKRQFNVAMIDPAESTLKQAYHLLGGGKLSAIPLTLASK